MLPDISGRKSEHFQIVAIDLGILGLNGYKNVNLLHSLTPNDYKCVDNKRTFTFMPHMVRNFTKFMIRTFFT